MKTYVVIPAYNEEDSLPLVLAELNKHPLSEIIVVDNNSKDGTAIKAESAGATLLRESYQGYGAACLKALNYLFEREEHPERSIIVFIDADYSDYPEELPLLSKPIERGEADFVVGSRLLLPDSRQAVPPVSRLGNSIASLYIRFLYGMPCSDLGPFRAIRMDALQGLSMSDRTWGWTIEMQLKAARKELRVREVPVRYRTRHAGESKISGSLVGAIRASVKILWTLGKYSLVKV